MRISRVSRESSSRTHKRTQPKPSSMPQFESLAAPPRRNGTIMKNTSQPRPKAKRPAGLRAEYRFDYTKAKPNRFAERTRPGSVAILLDPDVARVFKSAKDVNTVLRALVATMPPRSAATNR